MARPLAPLPRTIPLPWGYVAKVKLVPAKECKEENGEILDGWWDSDTQTIYVKKTLPIARRRYMVGHEFNHAVIDWVHRCLNEEIMKI